MQKRRSQLRKSKFLKPSFVQIGIFPVMMNTTENKGQGLFLTALESSSFSICWCNPYYREFNLLLSVMQLSVNFSKTKEAILRHFEFI